MADGNGNSNKPLIAKGWFHMTMWSFGMFILIGVAFFTGKEIPAGAVTIYGMVLGCYAASTTAVKVKGKNTEGEVKLTK